MQCLYSTIRVTVVALASLFLTGCAALKLDVDVYKGPLANSEDVQMEQLAVLAIGAEPVLTQLAKIYSNSDNSRDPCDNTHSAQQNRLWYISPDFKHAVNNICLVLQLYEDDKSVELQNKLTGYLQRAQMHFKRLNEFNLQLQTAKDKDSDSYAKALTQSSKELENIWNIGIGAVELGHDYNMDVKSLTELARLVADLTDTKELAIALSYSNSADGEGSNVTNAFKMLIDKATNDTDYEDSVWDKDDWQDTDYEYTRDILVNALVSSAGAANALREVNENYKANDEINNSGNNQSDDNQNENKRLETRNFWRTSGNKQSTPLGVVNRYPISEIDEQINFIESSTIAAFKNHFAAGRLKEGINTLINNYLEASDVSTLNDACQQENAECEKKGSKDAHKKRLISALIRFSQKMLVIADTQTLLEEPQNEQREKLRSIFFPNNINVDKPVIVLQAIGNSILNLANELIHREEHKQASINNKHSALNALQTATNVAAETYITSLVEKLNADLKTLKADKEKETTEIDKIEAQLTKLTEQLTTQQNVIAELTQAADLSSATLNQAKQTLGQTANHQLMIDAYRTLTCDKSKTIFDIFPLAKSDAGFIDSLTTNLCTVTLNELKTNLEKQTGPIAKESAIDLIKNILLLQQGAILLADRHDHERSRITNTITFLTPQVATLESGAAMDWFNNIVKNIKSNVVRLELSIASEKTQADADQTALEEAKNALASLEKTQQTITQNKQNLEQNVLLNSTKISTKQSISQIFQNAVNNLDAKLIGLEKPTTAFEAYNLLLLYLGNEKDKLSNDTDEADKTMLSNAIAYVKQHDPASITISALSDGTDTSKKEPKNQIAVLDDLIETLQYQRIAVASSVGESPQLQNIELALSKAMKHRQSLILIRPASAFLRSSQAATSLQNGQHLGFENLLKANVDRGEDLKRITILNEIDKQYWQNINSVTLRGAGDTNYAVAKDDIGNWYVKGYSNDVGPIVNSAQKLAMYAAGQSIGKNLLLQNELQTKLDNGDATTSEKNTLDKLKKGGIESDDSPISQSFVRSKKTFSDQTETARQSLIEKLAALEISLNAAWNSALNATSQEETTVKTVSIELFNATKANLETISDGLEKVAPEEKSDEYGDDLADDLARSVKVIDSFNLLALYQHKFETQLLAHDFTSELVKHLGAETEQLRLRQNALEEAKESRNAIKSELQQIDDSINSLNMSDEQDKNARNILLVQRHDTNNKFNSAELVVEDHIAKVEQSNQNIAQTSQSITTYKKAVNKAKLVLNSSISDVLASVGMPLQTALNNLEQASEILLDLTTQKQSLD